MAKLAPSFASLASTPDPLQELGQLVAKLRSATAETRYLEWKRGGLFDPAVTTRTKYRAVKAAISFANADGGFVVFGIHPNGTWEGLTDEQLFHFDPAKITELINGVVFPELPEINYAEFSDSEKNFAVVHVPPSGLIPHVTTRKIVETDASGVKKTVIERHAVYFRQGARSAVATPLQHQKIVERRTSRLRDELLRRVREVPIATAGSGRASKPSAGGTGTVMTIARLTRDANAPAVRVTRVPAQSSGVLLHEELSDGLFDEINNVLDANGTLGRQFG